MPCYEVQQWCKPFPIRNINISVFYHDYAKVHLLTTTWNSFAIALSYQHLDRFKGINYTNICMFTPKSKGIGIVSSLAYLIITLSYWNMHRYIWMSHDTLSAGKIFWLDDFQFWCDQPNCTTHWTVTLSFYENKSPIYSYKSSLKYVFTRF